MVRDDKKNNINQKAKKKEAEIQMSKNKTKKLLRKKKW
jgi:hypothetical protein